MTKHRKHYISPDTPGISTCLSCTYNSAPLSHKSIPCRCYYCPLKTSFKNNIHQFRKSQRERNRTHSLLFFLVNDLKHMRTYTDQNVREILHHPSLYDDHPLHCSLQVDCTTFDIVSLLCYKSRMLGKYGLVNIYISY